MGGGVRAMALLAAALLVSGCDLAAVENVPPAASALAQHEAWQPIKPAITCWLREVAPGGGPRLAVYGPSGCWGYFMKLMQLHSTRSSRACAENPLFS
jgi:hypothetical protein